MGEVIDMERSPHFNIVRDGSPESQQADEAFRQFDQLIQGNPTAVIAAIEVYTCAYKPGNRNKSIQEILVIEGIGSTATEVLPAFGAWQLIDQSGYYHNLGDFDDEVEASFSQNEQLRELVKELRDPRNRNRGETQSKIRATRMKLYIGHIITNKAIEEIEQDNLAPVKEMASSPDAA